MISVVNGFACLSTPEVPLAKAGIDPAHPENGVVPVRPAPSVAAAEPDAEPHIDVKA